MITDFYNIIKTTMDNLPHFMLKKRSMILSTNRMKNVGMRQAAAEVGISLATYQRAEHGKDIEVKTLLLIVKWMETNSPDVQQQKDQK